MAPASTSTACGNLTATEAECDNLDNNCNGACDENYPDVAVNGAGCNNPRTAKACSGGQGVCQLTGSYSCNAGHTAEQCSNGAVVIGANGDPSKATDEKCNGKDDDCNGLVDERTDYTVGATTFKGWHDPVATVAVGADPFTGQGAHTVYVYAYEASRPDATAVSPGSLSSRACSNYGVLPWANVTLEQAQAACAGVKDSAGAPLRVCSAWEWQQTCDGNVAASTHWSMSVVADDLSVPGLQRQRRSRAALQPERKGVRQDLQRAEPVHLQQRHRLRWRGRQLRQRRVHRLGLPRAVRSDYLRRHRRVPLHQQH